MEIIRGKIQKAKKVVIYGPEGIGKSTLASKFPDPVFIDTEGSTAAMDVARLPKPTSWELLLSEVQEIIDHPETCKTLVIDTADWAEKLCIKSVLDQHEKKGIEDFGYGKGYVYVQEAFGRLLNKLSDLCEKGVNAVVTAHAIMRKFEQPDEMGAYDRWELKLSKQDSPMVKEWADMVLFCNYKTFSVAVDDKGRKHKAQGGKRVMHANHHPCWDAKNRYGLPDELEMSYEEIRGVIEDGTSPEKIRKEPDPTPSDETQKEAVQQELNLTPPMPDSVPEPKKEDDIPNLFDIDPNIPKALRDLMETNGVLEHDIQTVVAARGYFPADMPVKDYPKDFIDGVLVGAWGQVFDMIKEAREKEEIPF